MGDELVVLEGATLVRAGGEVVLRDVSWTLREGEAWGIVGRVGSGKTTLAEALLGRHRARSGRVAWPLVERLRAQGRPVAWASEVVHLVSFKEDSWRFSYARHYYQQRFNFIEPQDDLKLETFLAEGTAASDEEVRGVARRLGIEAQLPVSLIALSNGQTRRARIARALLARPEVLVLDEPFLGLDVAGRQEVADILEGLFRRGTRIVLITRWETLPGWVTHVAELEGGTLRRQGRRAAVPPPAREPEEGRVPAPPAAAGAPVVELHRVNVRHGGRRILEDVSWTVRAGERWAVLGPNGSGKTTLLSLLCGDHPQAYSNDIRLFGRQRGSGETIWDIKRRVGLLSPELHLYFSEPLTAFQTVATGCHDGLAYRPVTAEQERRAHRLLAELGIDAASERMFGRLSTGEQRLVLLARALVKRPELVILDEPFQALDDVMIARARRWLDEQLGPEQTLLFVSHHAGEIPRSVSHWLRLEEGRVLGGR